MNFKIFLRNMAVMGYEKYNLIKTLEANDLSEAREKAKKFETPGWRIFLIQAK